MDYTTLGFDELLQGTKEVNSAGSTGAVFDTQNNDISGSKIQGGVMQSVDGKSTLDLEQGFFNISDGTTDVVQLGKLPDGSYGLIIRDRAGNVLFQFTGSINIIQSANGRFITDYAAEQFLLKDEGGTPIGLWGRQDGGF